METTMPKMMDHASPLKMGSRVIGHAPRVVVPAVKKDGPETDGAGFDNGVHQSTSPLDLRADKVNQDDGIPNHDTA